MLNVNRSSDVLDTAAEQTEIMNANAVEAARQLVQSFEEGIAGECDNCGREVPRLVKRRVYVGQADLNLCGRCRDELRVG